METQAKTVPNNLVVYYSSLANGAAQRKFMRSVKEQTGAVHITVRQWLLNGVIPISPRDREIIATLCGKTVLEFWGDIQTSKRGGKNRVK